MFSLILHGRRPIELQKWRNLRFALKLSQNEPALSNSFSSASAVSPPQDDRKGKTFTVSYLVDSLGFTTKLAESISRKVISEGKGNPDSVLSLLKSHGFTDSQISSVVRVYPRLLIADAETSLAPKLQFLQSRGASTSELTEILSKVPKILRMKKDEAISRYYDFVKDVIEADKSSDYEMSCLSLPQGNKVRNVLALRELGVPQRLLFPLLISHIGPVHGKERFEESLKKVVDMGFDPTTSRFVNALCVVYQMSGKTIDEKANVYKRLGLDVGHVWEMFKKFPTSLTYSEKKIFQKFETLNKCGLLQDEVCSVFKRYPPCIGLSAETVKKKTEFLVKEMNWPLKALVLFPQVLGYSMEKRIVPRCNVIRALMSKGLRGSELPSMPSVLARTDQAFLNKYVIKHDDKTLVRELMAIFTKNRAS